MATVVGRYENHDQARAAVERLRALDIPAGSITVTPVAGGIGEGYIVTTEVLDSQAGAVQQALGLAAGAAGLPANTGAGMPATMANNEATAGEQGAQRREDYTPQTAGGAAGAVAGGLAGAAIGGPVGGVVGALVGAAGGAAAGDAVSDDSREPADAEFGPSVMDVGTAGPTLGTRNQEGATADADVAAMAGPGIMGNSAVGGPTGLTARAAAIGSAEDIRATEGDAEDPYKDTDTQASTSPR